MKDVARLAGVSTSTV
ncbi:TPA: LacI family DNA-binding transcriptional regulator, partial [Escherichia coli]|nr:LacI family DNA-binding transcriptional regulator [Escherichia coli]